jgi:hypothetical protein
MIDRSATTRHCGVWIPDTLALLAIRYDELEC